MDFNDERRKFLQFAGTGAALSLAGCNALQNDDQESNGGQQPSQSQPTDSGDGTATVTVAIQVDQQQLQQRQSEIQSALESGNISRSEAQKRYRTAQSELRSTAASEFEERVQSNSKLTIQNAVRDLGVFLVSGDPAALIDSLSFAEVSALLAEAVFQRAQRQAQAGGTGTPTTTG